MDELQRRGHAVERQQELPLTYRGRTRDPASRIDLLVNRRVLVEVTCSERSARVHARQLRTDLRRS
jgi:GxxExxY protein